MTRRPRQRRHLNLDHLESFVALAESQSVTAAARRLRRSQPAVSQHLQRLEERLERTLITRSRRGAALTEAGLRLLPLARGLLRLNEQLAHEPDLGPLRLGACSNIGVYLLPHALAELRRLGHPLPEVSIASNPEIVRRLDAAEIDVALTEWWEHRPGFEARAWRDEPIVAILPHDHPLAARERIGLDDLRSVPVIGGEPGTGTGRLLRTCLRGRRPIETAMNLGSTEAVKRAVAAGLGASLVLQLSVAEHLVQPHSPLAVRELDPPLRKPLHVVWRAEISATHPLIELLMGMTAQ